MSITKNIKRAKQSKLHDSFHDIITKRNGKKGISSFYQNNEISFTPVDEIRDLTLRKKVWKSKVGKRIKLVEVV